MIGSFRGKCIGICESGCESGDATKLEEEGRTKKRRKHAKKKKRKRITLFLLVFVGNTESGMHVESGVSSPLHTALLLLYYCFAIEMCLRARARASAKYSCRWNLSQ